MKIVTHYDTLKVTQDAPEEVISAAYKALARLYHPDKAGSSADAVAMMQAINISYAVLSDSQKRAEHDAWIRKQERRGGSSYQGEERRKNRPSSFQGEDRRRQAAHPEERAKADKAVAEVGKWKAWADKTLLDAKEAKQRLEKALADLAKAKPEDRPKWEAWVKKTEQDVKEAQQRADKAAEQYAQAMSSAVETSR